VQWEAKARMTPPSVFGIPTYERVHHISFGGLLAHPDNHSTIGPVQVSHLTTHTNCPAARVVCCCTGLKQISSRQLDPRVQDQILLSFLVNSRCRPFRPASSQEGIAKDSRCHTHIQTVHIVAVARSLNV
jgi:hypothetical protein